MYTFLRLRSQDSLEDLCDTFARYSTWPQWSLPEQQQQEEQAAPSAMARPHTSHDTYYSTASSPSLRSREPIDMERPFTPPGSDAGNVKVVVRVRKFVKRGIYAPPEVR